VVGCGEEGEGKEEMSEITFADGTKIIYVQCDCGLTGGCKKCHPFVYTPEMQQWDIDLAEQGMDEYGGILLNEDR